MNGSYRQCAQCGKRALSIATRCPGCGRELLRPAVPERRLPDFGRLVSPRGVVATLAVSAALAAVAGARRGPARGEEESSLVMTRPLAAVPLAAAPRHDTASVPAPAATHGQLLVARTWTNVRSRPSVKGKLEAILTPGDTVLVDSLSQGWYRVMMDGEVLGYARRSVLVGRR